MRSFMFDAQFRVLRYFSTNWLASLNLNIPFNMRESFRLTDFRNTLYYLNKQRISSSLQLEFVSEPWIAREAIFFF
jgi:hypothetical protein